MLRFCIEIVQPSSDQGDMPMLFDPMVMVVASIHHHRGPAITTNNRRITFTSQSLDFASWRGPIAPKPGLDVSRSRLRPGSGHTTQAVPTTPCRACRPQLRIKASQITETLPCALPAAPGHSLPTLGQSRYRPATIRPILR
jgi:hypothetical protein